MDTSSQPVREDTAPLRGGVGVVQGIEHRRAINEPVLLVAPERSESQQWRAALGQGGFIVEFVPDPDAGLARARESGITLVVVDVGDEAGRGVQLVRTLRDEGNPAIVLVVAPVGDVDGVVEALESGADGCVDSMCSGRELVAHLAALVRRPRPDHQPGRALWIIGDLRVDPGSRCVSRNTEQIILAPREFAVLIALLRRRGRAVSREEMLRDVWRHQPRPTLHSIDALVRDLRSKLEPNKRSPRYILTVRSRGYLIPW
jgi:DNA-binding response OmpR family regulator